MGFDNKDNFRRSRSDSDRGERGGDRDRGGRFGGRGGDRGRRPGGGQSGNSGRIDNFEKPLLELLKEINEKLDLLLKNN